MQIDDLNTAVAKLGTDVTALLAAAPPAAPDLSGVIAAVQAIDAAVVAATPAPSTGTGSVTPPAGNPTLPSS